MVKQKKRSLSIHLMLKDVILIKILVYRGAIILAHK